MNLKETIVFKKFDVGYWPTTTMDKYISSLAWMLEEGNYYINWIKGRLLGGFQGKHPGDASLVIFSDDKVFVEPLYGDDAEDYRFELSRDALLKLINDWQALVVQEPDEIIMMRDEQGVITLESIFKERTL